MEEALKGNKPSEVHCIEAIQELNEPNVRRLTEALFMTRGAVSKLTKRLEQRGLIESYKNPDNKKEVYFRLTEAVQKSIKYMKTYIRNFNVETKKCLTTLQMKNLKQ